MDIQRQIKTVYTVEQLLRDVKKAYSIQREMRKQIDFEIASGVRDANSYFPRVEYKDRFEANAAYFSRMDLDALPKMTEEEFLESVAYQGSSNIMTLKSGTGLIVFDGSDLDNFLMSEQATPFIDYIANVYQIRDVFNDYRFKIVERKGYLLYTALLSELYKLLVKKEVDKDLMKPSHVVSMSEEDFEKYL